MGPPPPEAAAPYVPGHRPADPAVASFAAKLFRFGGPGLLIAVGYMDPGNWATDIAAGSRYGYSLLFVVAGCSMAAILLQSLAMRLGIVTGRDLAQLSRDHYPPALTKLFWLLAELAIVACDIAEVLGGALAFNLLLGVPLWAGVLLTGLDTVLVLGLQRHGFRSIEAIILALVLTIAGCFAAEMLIAGPDLAGIARGLVPSSFVLRDPHALYLAIGILGATVMPHNLYLHSSIVQSRVTGQDAGAKREAIRFATVDIVAALLLATLVNAAILILAASTFHEGGHFFVAEIEEAHRLLAPITGMTAAAVLFGVALLASGQSATFTGTIAGQIVLEGFLHLRIPAWQRRAVTRGLALVPALVGVLVMGDHAVGRLLVLTQVVLSAQLPFAIWPLIRFTSDARLMGEFASPAIVRAVAWVLFTAIVAANLWLVVNLFG